MISLGTSSCKHFNIDGRRNLMRGVFPVISRYSRCLAGRSRGFRQRYSLCRSQLQTIFVLLHALAVLVVIGLCAGQENDYAATPMVSEEKEAFYDVVKALNPELDWQTMYSDPCGESSLQGTSCDVWGGYWFFTVLSFGPVYDNTPFCARNASIHSSIGKLKHLKSLSFYQCFTGDNRTIAVELAELSESLELLTFRDNAALVGGIPAEIGALLRLRRLVLSGNSLEGAIPSELGKMSRLLQLDLSQNMLEGSIPGTLGNLSDLVVLDLSNNMLAGQIPRGLANAYKLEKLDLSRNMLQDVIPDSIGSLLSLILLDLSYNKLHGCLPTSLLHLTNLRELYLNNNELNGAIPDIWEGFSQLISLDLCCSAYEGAIPPTFGALINIRSLNLMKNRLTGAIPRALGNLPLIYSLHLNDNNLSGPVPFSAAFLQRLGSNLFLNSNAGLCSITSMGDVSTSNLKVCSSAVTTVPQLISTLTLTNSVHDPIVTSIGILLHCLSLSFGVLF